MSRIPEELIVYIEEKAESFEYQLIDVSTKGASSAFIEISLDKEGGISLDECAEFNRNISTWIDNKGLFGGVYTLDVCSPGLDRALKSDREYQWAIGKEVKISTYEPVGDKRDIIGKLLELNGDESIVIEEDGKPIAVNRKNIAKAKLKISI